MAVSEKTKIDADSILCQLSDGTTTVEWDVAEDSQPCPAQGAHTVNKFTSQKIKSQGIVKDGVYENVTLTVTYLRSEAEQVKTWWKAATPLTYSVTDGTNTDVYTDCQVRVSQQPKIIPGKNDYVTMQIEIAVLMSINAADASAGSGSDGSQQTPG